MDKNNHDRIVVLTAGIGLFLSTLDSGIINVALPTLVRTFHSNISTMAWTITLYTLALTGTIIIFGRLSDRFGRLKIYTGGLALFAIASVLCGFAASSTMLIILRTIQGIGAAMLQATAVAIVTTGIPNEKQGSALGTLAVLMGLGPVLGPSIGGVLLSLEGWPWIFWMNIPISLFGLWGCRQLAQSTNESIQPIGLDAPGNLLLSISMLSLLYGVTVWSNRGITRTTLLPLALFVMLFILFIRWEMRTKKPIINLTLFRNGNFSAPVLAIFVFGGATSLGFIVPPYFLEQVHHLAPWQVGLVNLSAPLGIVLLSKVSGRLMKSWGTMRLMIMGLIIMLIAYSILSGIDRNWPPDFIAVLLFLYGIGGGIFLSPNIAAIMGAVNKQIHGTIGAVQRMVQNLGIALYTAVAAGFIHAHADGGVSGLLRGFRESWTFATVTILFSILFFAFIAAQRNTNLIKRGIRASDRDEHFDTT